MSKAKSVYLTERSMSALRPGDSLSGRLNQIVDRYMDVVDDERDSIMSQIGDDGFSELVKAWPDVLPVENWLDNLRSLLRSISGWPHTPGLSAAVMMVDLEQIVLTEMVEAERASMVALG